MFIMEDYSKVWIKRLGSQDSSVSIVTRIRDGRPGL
jgi:hypothetical protein